MKKIVFEFADGSVAHCVPCGKRFPGETDDAYLARIAATTLAKSSRLSAATVHYVDDLPEGHTLFKGARRWNGTAVEIDMTVARDIHMSAIRAARDAELVKLDKRTVEALGKGDDIARAAVETEKQALRDIPQSFDLGKAADPAALDALWPNGLVRRT